MFASSLGFLPRVPIICSLPHSPAATARTGLGRPPRTGVQSLAPSSSGQVRAQGHVVHVGSTHGPGLTIGLNKGGEEYNRGIMNITRRETLAGAIALICELGAAEVQARAGVKEEPSSPREKTSAESGSATGLESRSGAQSGAAAGTQGAERGGADLVFKHDLPNLTMDDWEVTVKIGRASCRERV